VIYVCLDRVWLGQLQHYRNIADPYVAMDGDGGELFLGQTVRFVDAELLGSD
jgi:hypothetical protein